MDQLKQKKLHPGNAISIYSIISLLSILFSTAAFGQEKEENGWIQDSSKEILKSMGVHYQKPHDFTEVMEMECFEDHQMFKKAFTCLTQKLISKDDECVIFMPINRILTKEDSIEINKIFRGSITSLNNFHISNARIQIKTLYKDENLSDWKSKVKYFSAKDAKSKFNADTALFYSLRLDPDISYGKKFNNIYSLFLQKKDKGFINIIVFYSDKIKMDFEKKLMQIESMVNYKY